MHRAIVTFFLCTLLCASSYSAPARLERRNAQEQQQAASAIEGFLAKAARQREMARGEALNDDLSTFKSLLTSNPNRRPLMRDSKKRLFDLISRYRAAAGGGDEVVAQEEQEVAEEQFFDKFLAKLPSIFKDLGPLIVDITSLFAEGFEQ